MLYFASLTHSPDKCPGVALEIRDRVVRMTSTMTEVLRTHGCAFQGGWVSKSAHLTFLEYRHDIPSGYLGGSSWRLA